ncbi:hypothetical protein TI39_contig359g00026 [Zymoseptoria brevis]|uniref:Uncharacterized protein n=1 Tax=Zymoseptoria brevis TaxID=1047168 RepID=A0A0F4GPU8_9PEZI|nr:hypothetical protein TI39_contig359g00026 [Zymoseptoria brevis]
MAFQQPQPRPKPVRQVSINAPPNQQQHPELQAPASPSRRRAIEDSQEWILFSPQNDGQSLSQTTSRTPRTATHLSDFGSLHTHVRSQQRSDSQEQEEDQDNGTCQGTDVDDDGAELDSLDDGLLAFHHPFAPSSAKLDQSGGAVLPTHDGLGSFFPSSAGIQEQLWQFERHNPHRRSGKHVRRRSSVQRRLDIMDEEQDVAVEDDRTERIEKWRLDQSKAVLEEIERETRRRRRRMSRASGTTARPSLQSTAALERVLSRRDSVTTGQTSSTDNQPPSESFWRRITRKVIKDLIGLDETTLSVIFGEQFVGDASPTPTQPSPLATAATRESRVSFHDSEPSWEAKLLDRIARELGVLVHQLAESDGTAFNSYKNALSQPIDYAGLPRAHPQSLRQRRRAETSRRNDTENAESYLFSPTVPQTPLTPATTNNNHELGDTSLWGIEEESASDDDSPHDTTEQEYWQRDIDVHMIFSYLRDRFARNTPSPLAQPSAESSGPLPASWATPTTSSLTPAAQASRKQRAEVIRRQHPLVSRAETRRGNLLAQVLASQTPQKRASSCASQSTKRSRRSRGSSRNYWDLGGDNSASWSASGGGAAEGGGWGEV